MLFPSVGRGSDQGAQPEHKQAGDHGEEHHDGIHHRHHLGAFVGGSHSKGKDGFTVGAEYEFRFHRYVGAGFVGELVGGGFREGIAAFPVFFHPTDRIILAAGIGWERPAEIDDEHGRRILYRLSFLYKFPVKPVAIYPNVSVDFVGGTAVFVYGVTVGFGF